MCTGKMEVLNGKKEKVAKKRFIRLLTAVHTGYYPCMILKKMSSLRLEDFVTRLIEHCPNEYYSRGDVISKKSRPRWWPKYLEFIIPIKKLKMNVKGKEWASTLRNLVASCSNFYRINLLHNIISPNFVQATDRNSVQRKRSRRNVCWTFKSGTDSSVILKREIKVDTEKACLNLPKDLSLQRNVVPFVKLYDITKDLSKLLRALKSLEVVVVDIIKYPVEKKKVSEQLPSPKHRKRHKKLLPQVTHVRLHDLFEKPKDVHYTKDEFLNYLNLGKREVNTNPTCTYNRTISSRILRNNNIPISSDLGRYGLQSKGITNNQVPWKTQKLEWYLREVPEANSNQHYTVTYSIDQSDEWTHHYTFPKKQQHQKTPQSLRLYSQLRKCKPLCVRVKRMDLGTVKKINT